MIVEADNPKQPNQYFVPDKRVDVPDKTPFIGIEVEVENIENRVSLTSEWISVEDGSLRNNGIEFVSMPMKASNAVYSLKRLKKALEESNPDYHFSLNTSIHIHLNALDFSQNELAMFKALYIIFERSLYNFVGRERKENIFCLPMHESSVQFNSLGKSKYYGLNFKSLDEHNTIEFRQMHGTLDLDKLSLWIHFITSMRSFVKKSTKKHFDTFMVTLMPYYIEAQYANLLYMVFGSEGLVLRNSTFESDIRKGFIFLKYVVAKDRLRFSVPNDEEYSRESSLYLKVFGN